MNFRFPKVLLQTLLYCIICLISINSPAFAQKEKTFTKADTVCYRYNFIKGDSLLYRVISQDSIVFYPQDAVVKERVEIYMIICDSIGKNGHFFLSQTMVDYASKESSGTIRDQVRLESPWLKRKVWFEIDSVGNRYSYGAEDTLKADVSPGGAFQPNLFFPFKESCKHKGESWIVATADDLPENSIPPAYRRNTSLFRVLPNVDTLGQMCNSLQYTLTAQGNVRIPYTNGQMLTTNSVIAQFGILHISQADNVPVHFYATAEIKLSVKAPNGKELKGTQYITSNFKLVEFHSSRFPEGIRPTTKSKTILPSSPLKEPKKDRKKSKK
ncbi:MAG: hypothetical protein HYZ54_02145 [Ignavibacteriae bacterium]|nr:hypothetical protein [Ignavibacteriota bacterium]